MKLIDADILERSLTEIDEHINMDIFTNEVRELIDNAPTVEAIPKGEYENRLKADMVAMLTDLRTEIYKMSDTVVEPRTVTITSWKGMQKRICNCIQQKINKLKEDDK